jgi:hypothetical protein
MSMGFCDAAFLTRVLNCYKGLPLPAEEWPMFCYPSGCQLYHAKYCDAPLSQYFGFMVKNKRGDALVEAATVLSSQKLGRLVMCLRADNVLVGCNQQLPPQKTQNGGCSSRVGMKIFRILFWKSKI